MHPKQYYIAEISKFTETLGSWKRRRNAVTASRLVVFLLLVWTVYGIAALDTRFWLWAGLVALVGFVVLGVADGRVVRKLRYYEELLRCCRTESDYLEGNFGELPEGVEFMDPGHGYAADLDIFGEDSLFRRLNRTATHNGRQLLVGWLLHPCRESAEIRSRQEAAAELAASPDWMLQFRAIGVLGQRGEIGAATVEQWLKEPCLFGSGFWKWGCYLQNGLTVAAWVAGIASWTTYVPAVWLSILQLGIVAMNVKRINRMHGRLGSFIKALSGYTGLVEMVAKGNFRVAMLRGLQGRLTGEGQGALGAFRELNRILGGFDQRANVLVAIVLNGLYMRDIHVAMRLGRWRERYGEKVEEWLGAVAEADALVSLATFRFNHPDYAVPEITDEVILAAQGVGHPFLGSETRVRNDFGVRDLHELYIVTGANMAGKSTFLRTVGVNLVLALMGGPVCAAQFRCRPVGLFTSMRTTDNLTKGTSYFHAELLRLQQLVRLAEAGRPLFIILDEMLKGTNSHDKLNGSLRFLEKLLAYPVCGLVATHDLALGELETRFPARFRNVCFEIGHAGDEIVYDYKLHSGVSRNMNASILLERMGLI